MLNLKSIVKITLLSTPLLLAACGGGDTEEPEQAMVNYFEITIVNVTANQPMAPAAVILHNGDYSGWTMGSPATVGLETLAESGSPSSFIEEAQTALDTQATDGMLAPGQSAGVRLSGEWSNELSLTLAVMPVNTNDGFVGITGWNLSDMQIGETVDALLPVYDAGTEANMETLATIPGPAAGGEGFNAERNDIADRVTRHPGVVTIDDGLTGSVLDESHRFNQGALLVQVTRTQ